MIDLSPATLNRISEKRDELEGIIVPKLVEEHDQSKFKSPSSLTNYKEQAIEYHQGIRDTIEYKVSPVFDIVSLFPTLGRLYTLGNLLVYLFDKEVELRNEIIEAAAYEELSDNPIVNNYRMSFNTALSNSLTLAGLYIVSGLDPYTSDYTEAVEIGMNTYIEEGHIPKREVIREILS